MTFYSFTLHLVVDFEVLNTENFHIELYYVLDDEVNAENTFRNYSNKVFERIIYRL